jgi:hypothetical protein
MPIKILSTTSFILLAFNLHAQSAIEEHEDHDHHHHHRNEIGIANSAVYFVKEDEYSYGLHIHYLHNLPESKFSLGAGYERIFDEHKHQTIGLVLGYRPVERLNVNLGPGLAFEGIESAFALHLEMSYEYEIGDIHLGPVIELALEKEDYHFSLGIHLGYGF